MRVKEREIRFVELELGALHVIYNLILSGRYWYPAIPKGEIGSERLGIRNLPYFAHIAPISVEMEL